MADSVLPTGPDLVRDGWEVLSFPGIAASTFAGKGSDGIELTADHSSALLYRAVTSNDSRRRFLSWRWRVDQPGPTTDLSRKGEDDRPLAIHLWFMAGEAELDLWDRLVRGVQHDVLGVPLGGRVLTYVWGGEGERGRKIVNPHIGRDGILIVLRAANSPTGHWFREKVDIAADFEMAFGELPPKASYIALSADSDDTGTRTVGTVSDIAFTSR